MKTLKNRLILKADLSQKSILRYGTLTLYMPPKQEQLSVDGKVTNPVIAEVIVSDRDYPHIKAGDLLVLNHNVINNKSFQTMEVDGSVVTLVIPRDKSILGKLNEAGEVVPLCYNILAERVMKPPVSEIIFVPDLYRKTEENKVKVLAVAPEVKNIEPGEYAIVYTHSDYECHYNVDGERRSAVIVWCEDVVATEPV